MIYLFNWKITNKITFEIVKAFTSYRYQDQIRRNHKSTVSPYKDSPDKENFVLSFLFHLRVQGQMAQRINVVLNSIPSGCRDLAEFAFFCGVGLTFGSLGLIWHVQLFLFNKQLFRS